MTVAENPFSLSPNEVSLIDLVGNKPNTEKAELEKIAVSISKDRSIPFEKQVLKEQAAIVTSKNKFGKYLIGGKKTALVIPAYNRHNDLITTYSRLASVLQQATNKYSVDLFVSQNGDDRLVTTTMEMISRRVASELPFCSFEKILFQHSTAEESSGYLRYSSHLNFIFETLFVTKKYDQVIVLEVLLFLRYITIVTNRMTCTFPMTSFPT